MLAPNCPRGFSAHIRFMPLADDDVAQKLEVLQLVTRVFAIRGGVTSRMQNIAVGAESAESYPNEYILNE